MTSRSNYLTANLKDVLRLESSGAHVGASGAPSPRPGAIPGNLITARTASAGVITSDGAGAFTLYTPGPVGTNVLRDDMTFFHDWFSSRFPDEEVPPLRNVVVTAQDILTRLVHVDYDIAEGILAYPDEALVPFMDMTDILRAGALVRAEVPSSLISDAPSWTVPAIAQAEWVDDKAARLKLALMTILRGYDILFGWGMQANRMTRTMHYEGDGSGRATISLTYHAADFQVHVFRGDVELGFIETRSVWEAFWYVLECVAPEQVVRTAEVGGARDTGSKIYRHDGLESFFNEAVTLNERGVYNLYVILGLPDVNAIRTRIVFGL